MQISQPGDLPPSQWADQGEVARWQMALEGMRLREIADRGVYEPVGISARASSLWACYGALRVQVAGERAEVGDEDALFVVIDRWVAFDRDDGRSPLLERDLRYIEEVRATIPTLMASWQAILDLVVADIGRTVPSLRGEWQVVDWVRGLPPQVLHRIHGQGGVLPQIPVLPGVWLRSIRGEYDLWPNDDDPDVMTEYLAALLQDEVIEEAWTAWPDCPGHEHPAQAVGGSWTCPDTRQVLARIGQLQS